MPKKRKNIFRTGARLPNTILKWDVLPLKKQCSATGKTTHCIGTCNALHWAMEGTALSRTKAESLHDNESTYYGKTLERANPSQGG